MKKRELVSVHRRPRKGSVPVNTRPIQIVETFDEHEFRVVLTPWERDRIPCVIGYPGDPENKDRARVMGALITRYRQRSMR